MKPIPIAYCTYGKAVAPDRIKLSTSSWAGAPQKMEDGSDPQPWHCLPFVEGSTYGLELLFQYDADCQVINESGAVRFEWNSSREEGVSGGEFMLFAPRKAPRYYMFNTGIDLLPPEGYVIRTEPHPRYFTDDTGTVPLSMIGHIQNEWWPRRVFVVFRVPPPGHRHIFRKGEGYAQLLFVPHRVDYDLKRMEPEKEKQRRELDLMVNSLQHHIATNVWQSPDGGAFSNYYKVLASAFARNGNQGVEQAVEAAVKRQAESLPTDRSIEECLQIAEQHVARQQFVPAGEVLRHVLTRDPGNAMALRGLSIVIWSLGSPLRALELMTQAASIPPGSAMIQADLGEMLRRLGRFAAAEAAFSASLKLCPDHPRTLALLGCTLASLGRRKLALSTAQRALSIDPGCQEALGLIEALAEPVG